MVAVPVRNEAERIGACLDALETQRGIEPGSCGVVLFLNNCTDDTAAILAGRVSRVPLRLVRRHDPGAHAGWARREAMEAAAAWLEEGSGSRAGLLLTTDADSRVPPDWVAKNLVAVSAGADAVAGRIALEPEEAGRLPERLHARGRLEGTYDALLAEMAALLDPAAHDPWPNHGCVSGASLAARLSTYRAVGGMPAIRSARQGLRRGADAALAGARERCADRPNVSFRRAEVPADWPAGRFDLVLLSEVVYYLDHDDIGRLVDRVRESLEPDGSVLLVHWTGETDYPLSADDAVDTFILRSTDLLRPAAAVRTEHYRLDRLAR